MNKQICSILFKVMNNGNQPVMLEELASEYKVSVRTIRNYWQEMKDFLLKNNLIYLFNFTNASIIFTGSVYDIQNISKLILNLDFYEYKLSGEERQNLIMLILLCEDSPIKIIQLEEMLYASKATLLNDLESLKEKLKK